MRPCTETSSQQSRQYIANVSRDAADATARRADTLARIRAAYVTRQNRRTARRLGVTLTNHSEIMSIL